MERQSIRSCPLIELFAPSAGLVVDNDDFDDLNAFIGPITLTEDGLYRVAVQDYSGLRSDYYLTLLDLGEEELGVYQQEAEQINACTALTRDAYGAIQGACGGTGSNQMCVIGAPISLQSAAGDQTLSDVGATVSLSDVRVLQSTALDETANSFGMAYMRLPTHTQSGSTLSMDVIVVGNASILDPTIENIVLDEPQTVTTAEATPLPRITLTLTLTVTGGASINIRQAPSTSAGIVGSGKRDTTFEAVGRNADTSWFNIELPDGGTGWVFRDLVTIEGDGTTLPVVEAETAGSTTSNASAPANDGVSLFMTSTRGNSQCKRGPESGLMLHTS